MLAPRTGYTFVPLLSIRYGVVGNISACHADARGSIPRIGVLLLSSFKLVCFTYRHFQDLFFLRSWSSLVMTPASHAGNPEFESRRA